eukprot:PhF_6_TR29397/c0_g1_i2/m.43384
MYYDLWSKLQSISPDKPFIRKHHHCSTHEWITYGAFTTLVMRNPPLRFHNKNDVVVVLSSNSFEMILFLFVCWRDGVVPLLVSTRLNDVVVQNIIAKSNAKHVVVSEDIFQKRNFPDDVAVHVLEQLITSNPGGDYVSPQFQIHTESICVILHTSGTTSTTPKLVPLTHYNVCANQRAQDEDNYNPFFDESTHTLLWLPLFHGFGLLTELFRIIWVGGKVTLLTTTTTRNTTDLGTALREVSDPRINGLCVVPSVLDTLLQENQSNESLLLRGLRFVMVGGGRVSRTALEKSTALQIPLCHVLGMTETAGSLLFSHREGGIMGEFKVPLPPMFHEKWKESITGGDTHELILNMTGAPHQHRPVTLGYLGTSQEEEFRTEFATGDLFRHASPTRVEHCGRADACYKNSNGETTNPCVLEALIESHLVTTTRVLVVGKDAPYNTLVVEHRRPTDNDNTTTWENTLWFCISHANRTAVAATASPILRLVILPEGILIPTTAKGSIDRSAAHFVISPYLDAHPTTHNIQAAVRGAVEVVHRGFCCDDVIPLDSLSCVVLRSEVLKRLHKTLHGNVPSLSELITSSITPITCNTFVAMISGTQQQQRPPSPYSSSLVLGKLHRHPFGAERMFCNQQDAIHCLQTHLNISLPSDWNLNLKTSVEHILQSFLQTVPFQSITMLAKPLCARRMLTMTEIRTEVERRRGGLCYVMNVFVRELLLALGIPSKYVMCSIHGVQDCHMSIVVAGGCFRDDASQFWCIDVGCGYNVPFVMPLPSSTQSFSG